MSLYSSRLINKYPLTKEQYNYLLPVFGICGLCKTDSILIIERENRFAVLCTERDYKSEVSNRLEILN